MGYTIKQNFTVKDLQVGNLVYDAVHDAIMKVAYIGHTKKESRGKNVTSITECLQIVMEDTKNGKIILVDITDKSGKLPNDKDGKPQFRHLIILEEESPTIHECTHCHRCTHCYRCYKYYNNIQWYHPSPSVSPNYLTPYDVTITSSSSESGVLRSSDNNGIASQTISNNNSVSNIDTNTWSSTTRNLNSTQLTGHTGYTSSSCASNTITSNLGLDTDSVNNEYDLDHAIEKLKNDRFDPSTKIYKSK